MQALSSVWTFVSSLWIFIVFGVAFIAAIIFLVRFLKKRKIVGIGISSVAVVAMVALGLIYLNPHSVIDVAAKNVSRIEVSGVSVTDKETINDILKDLGSSKYKRALLSGIGGYEEYSVIGFDEKNHVLFSIGLSTEQKVNTGLFWENRVEGKINLSLYEGIVSEARWQECSNTYTLSVKNTGEDESVAKYLEIAERSKKLLRSMEEEADIFVMDAYNYQDVDGDGTPLYTMNTLSYPVEIDPNGQSICVSKNYFHYNPIQTADCTDLETKIIYDDFTLNVLVPEKYRDMETEIVKAYRESFYFEKVTATNNYNKDAGIEETLDISKESLNINVIYVKDGQKYFTYRDDCAVQTDNFITDPIVKIYTSNVHCNYAQSYLSQWTYFYDKASTEEEAYQRILPYLESYDAIQSIPKVMSIYKIHCDNMSGDVEN